MITLITGAPGSGKSNALVSLLEGLGKERALYVNGIPELKIAHTELSEPNTWHDTVPDGSCIVIDEVQNHWRGRGPGQKVPDHIAKLETHRHRGLDFYVITQGPNLVDSNVRALVGRHVHLRDLGILGRWWYEWPECADNCRTSWKNAPIKKRYRLDKVAQAKYKSASIHVKPVRSVPWMLAVMVLALVVVAVMGWKSYSMISSKVAPAKMPAPTTATASGLPTPKPVESSTQGTRVIDDRVDWIPRISSKPETAPAYDELRKVAAMPVIAGGITMGKRVKCVTQQGTDAGVSEAECRAWLANPPFDPYTVAKQAPSPGTSAPDRPQHQVESGGSAVLIQDTSAKRS